MAANKVETGNSFHGYIYEFPGVRVDCFDNDPRPRHVWMDDVEFHLLTHGHSDHMKGLESKETVLKRVYCTKVTKEYIKTLDDGKYAHALHNLTPVEYDTPLQVNYKSSYLTITFISSNHCAGSAMILIQDANKHTNVLLTGDMRCEKWWVESLPYNEVLYPFTAGYKTLDNIYLDTTYAYRDEPFIEFPPNINGINIMNDMIAKYPLDDEDVAFYFADNILGFEDVWIKVFNRFGYKFHTKEAIRKREIPLRDRTTRVDQISHQKLLSEGSHAKFHICGKRPTNCLARVAEFNVRVKALIDITYEQYIQLNMCIPANNELAKSLEYVKTLPSGNKIYKRTTLSNFDIQYLLPKGSDLFLPSEIYYVFSRHSSFDEVCHFLSKFPKIGDITPIVEGPDSWAKGFQIARHFKDFCLKKEGFRYDTTHELIYGRAPCISNGPISRNKLAEIPTPQSFVTQSFNILKSKQFSFLGQDEMRIPFQKEESEETERQRQKYNYLYRKNAKCGYKRQYKIADMVEKGDYSFLDKKKPDPFLDDGYNNHDDDQYSDDGIESQYEAIRRINYKHSMKAQQAEIQVIQTPPKSSDEDDSVVILEPSIHETPVKKRQRILKPEVLSPRSAISKALLLSPENNEDHGDLDRKRIEYLELRFKKDDAFFVNFQCLQTNEDSISVLDIPQPLKRHL